MSAITNKNITSLFTISKADWTIINRRVGTVLEIEPAKEYATKVLPGYPDLLVSCKLWTSSTFNNLKSWATQLDTYATTAIQEFGALKTQVDLAVNNGGEVSATLAANTKTTLANLQSSTTTMADNYATLNSTLSDFVNNNQVVDQQWELVKSSYGDFWNMVKPYMDLFENAEAKVNGVWGALVSDINNLNSQTINVTMTFLESLDIQNAINQWATIQQEAKAFPVNMQGQPDYWTNPFKT